MHRDPVIMEFGDSALLVEFEPRIDPLINARVHALSESLRNECPGMIRFLIPAYHSLTVGLIDQEKDGKTVTDLIRTITRAKDEPGKLKEGRHFVIPCCYEGKYAPDSEAVMEHTGLKWETIVNLHTSGFYRIYMMGFLPGFPYMGILDDALYCPRKQSPRTRVHASSVAIAGNQTGIYPIDSPGGWQIIGRVPIPILSKDPALPCLFLPGDKVQFKAVTTNQFKSIKTAFNSGQYRLRPGR